MKSCLQILERECPGKGSIPYIVRRSMSVGVGDTPNPHLEAWVKEQGTLVDSISARDGAVEIWSLERQVLLAGERPAGLSPERE